MFNAKDFLKSQFEPRTEKVAVPELAMFFEIGETPEFEVRGLTANEMARCTDAVKRRENIELVLNSNAIANQQLADLLKELVSNTADLVPDLIRRIEMLCIQYPDIPPPVWTKISIIYPTVFFNLTQKIYELTGQGQNLVKHKPSGKIPQSEQP